MRLRLRLRLKDSLCYICQRAKSLLCLDGFNSEDSGLYMSLTSDFPLQILEGSFVKNEFNLVL